MAIGWGGPSGTSIFGGGRSIEGKPGGSGGGVEVVIGAALVLGTSAVASVSASGTASFFWFATWVTPQTTTKLPAMISSRVPMDCFERNAPFPRVTATSP